MHMIKKKTRFSIFLFLLILLPIYQDSPLVSILGDAGKTLLFPICLIGFLYFIFKYKKIPINNDIRKLFFLAIWLLIISYLGILVWLIFGGKIYYMNIFLPFKAFKVFLQYISYIVYVILITFYIKKNGIKRVLKYAYITFIVLGVIGIFEIPQLPYAYRSLHASAVFPYNRMRLLGTESSATASMIFIYGGISLFYNLYYKNKLGLLITILLFVFFISTTTSKTILLGLLIMLIVYLILNFKKISFKKLLLLIFAVIILVILGLYILPILQKLLFNDIQNYTSISTRSYTIIVGTLIGLTHPLGVGGAVYLPVLKESLKKYLFISSYYPFKFNSSEIYSILSSRTDDILTVKSGLLQYNMYWGILGTIVLIKNFILIFKNVAKKQTYFIKVLSALFLTMIILLTISLNFSFEFWLLYAIMSGFKERKEEVNG